jgi:hypothetical protein
MDADVSWPANTKVCVHKKLASERRSQKKRHGSGVP